MPIIAYAASHHRERAFDSLSEGVMYVKGDVLHERHDTDVVCCPWMAKRCTVRHVGDAISTRKPFLLFDWV